MNRGNGADVSPYVITYISAWLLYNRLFSQGANFPEFPEWPCNLGKFMLDCFYNLIVGCKRIFVFSLITKQITSDCPQLLVIGVHKVPKDTK